MSKATKCAATKSNGERCKGWAVEGSRYCQAHDPALKAQRKAWRSAGGLARSKPAPEGHPVELMTVADVLAGLSAVIGSAWKLSNSVGRARALTSAYLGALKVFEIEALQRRIEELAERLDEIEKVEDQRDARTFGDQSPFARVGITRDTPAR